MATINVRALKIAIQKPIDRACRQAARRIVEGIVQDAKEQFLDEFLNHDISREIAEGPNSEGGVLTTEGNLFSFLGFKEKSKPIKDLYEFLDENIYLGPTIIYDKDRQRYTFRAYIPTKDAIKTQTPMHWGTAASWVYSIETGIPALNRFLAAREKRFGRSTGGVQSKGVVTKGVSFRKRDYLSGLFEDFENTITRRR